MCLNLLLSERDETEPDESSRLAVLSFGGASGDAEVEANIGGLFSDSIVMAIDGLDKRLRNFFLKKKWVTFYVTQWT